jgi:hypothetical protein
VARSLAKNKTFHVRGITRNPESEKARELSEIGVEIVQADGWNKEQMLKAFKGSWGAFVNTNTEDPVSVTLISMIAPLEGPARGGCISSESERVRIEDTHFTGHKVRGCPGFLVTAVTTNKESRLLWAPEIAPPVAEYSNRSFHTVFCSWRTFPRSKSNNTGLRNASR